MVFAHFSGCDFAGSRTPSDSLDFSNAPTRPLVSDVDGIDVNMASTAPYYHNTRRSNNAGSSQGPGSESGGVAHYDAQTSATLAMSAGGYLGEDDSANQLASLLQAANSAAVDDHTAPDKVDQGPATPAATGRGKRKRVSSSPQASVGQPEDRDGLDDEAARMQLQQDATHSGDWHHQPPETRSSKRLKNNGSQGTMNSPPPLPQHVLNRPLPDLVTAPFTDPRSLGVHSAAALFRRSDGGNSTPGQGSPSTQNTPSGSAKKQTRPPMSKLYTSLRLSAENFLRLQSAAKAYMLDPAYPERQNCVGNRGRGDTDMVKLRLFNCVRNFLDKEGAGERFFGENVLNNETGSAFAGSVGDRDVAVGLGFANPDDDAGSDGLGVGGQSAPGERWIWPRDANKIVSLVTPLLRRMVTNERQRKYAIETRKGGKKSTDDPGSGGALPSPATPANVALSAHQDPWSTDKRAGMPEDLHTDSHMTPIDPSLQSQLETAPMDTAPVQQLIPREATVNVVKVFVVWAANPKGECLAALDENLSPDWTSPDLTTILHLLQGPLTRLGSAPVPVDSPDQANGEGLEPTSNSDSDRENLPAPPKTNGTSEGGRMAEVAVADGPDDEGSEAREDGTRFRKVRIQALGLSGMVDVANSPEKWEQVKKEACENRFMEGMVRVRAEVY